MNIKIFQTVEELNQFAAEKFIEIGNAAIEERNEFIVALAGGSTPKALYQLLASENYKNKIDWSKVFFFFGDERNVPLDDAESNFRMANETLFEPLEISEFNINRWNTEENDLNKIAESYEDRLIIGFSYAASNEELKPKSFNLNEENIEFPRFDLILLGMGTDGHTASLFPFTPALNETKKTAVANYVEKLNSWRFTLTFPVINNAANIIFLVKGEDKAGTLKKVLEGEFEPQKFPSQNVRPSDGNLFWLADSSAAGFLSGAKNV